MRILESLYPNKRKLTTDFSKRYTIAPCIGLLIYYIVTNRE